jgi:cytochrome c oxidase cbb3-type subunit III
MNKTDPEEADAPLRPHVYDEIQEYDKQLPNWWLWTLYASVIFAFCYWMLNQWIATTDPVFEKLERKMAQVELAKANNPNAKLTDAQLWTMSQNPDIVAAGQATFSTTCASCHGDDMKGKIGPSLVDNVWIHGGDPVAVAKTIRDGVLAKGMPAWGPMLGNKRVAEVAAFVLSHHKPTENP